ncbi:heme biosynthesis HemY N-terminal domain-containing protein [Azohydromonas caseinilytica]|uniref:Heme biosynthesis protein HemY n=1 Tax=Azohydromonas caseinilytica TaxID=2728836 RepID=A0A848F7L5_9BURK|nr:heme biosynthesis HemY N-terminal domain-containing protein [Azohydromonas caseinilytica]NML14051.1 heme biosynthesis protein HemY [Azohydromonas caseinilytica]
MRSVIWLVLLFVAAVVAAITLGANDGLVSLYWRGWRVDLSLNLFLLALLAGGAVLVSALQALRALTGLPQRAREWRALRRERAAQAALRLALAEFLAARYTRAQKAAQRALALREATPEGGEQELALLSHLLAAASAHRLQNRTERDEQLRQVLATRRGGVARPGDDAALLLAAEWALDDRDATQALSLLSELPPGTARRTQALRLRLQAQRLAQQPLQALPTARLLAKHQGFSALAAQGLLRSLAFQALEQAHDLDQLEQVWQSLDPSDRRDPFVAARAAQHAASLGAHGDARGWLRPLWERLDELSPEEREQIALALLQALPGIGADWLPRLESALQAYPQEPAVVVVAGAAFAERQLWGKARRPLEQSARDARLASMARRRAWRTLAQLAREEGDQDRAHECHEFAAALD